MSSAETFGRLDRLRKTGDFRRVYDRSSSFKKGFLAIRAAPGRLETTRLGITISSRVVKLSSDRNRLKRIAREAFRKNKGRLKKGFDIVISVRANPGDAVGYAMFEEIFIELVKMARILT